MICITQGHERGIGLEIFFKTFPLLKQIQKDNLILFCDRKNLQSYLKLLKIDYEINQNGVFFSNYFIKCQFSNKSKLPQSTTTLLEAMEFLDFKSEESSKLITLPTSKDQLIYKNRLMHGYTELFRKYYKNDNISMMFYAKNLKVLLITDHISIKSVPKKINTKLITQKVITTITGFEKYFGKIDEIIFSGINPHAGENGLIGTEDIQVEKSIIELKKQYKKKKFTGPFAGDSMLTKKNSSEQLFVYMFHDQGLSAFKAINQFYGINLSFGLPYLRASVDHGTAFELVGKNRANYMSLFYLFNNL